MSKRKVRLIECNNKRYTQYYNIYINKGNISCNSLRGLQTKINKTKPIKSTIWESKNKKSIIKGISITNNKKYSKYIAYIYPLYLRKYFNGRRIKNFSIIKIVGRGKRQAIFKLFGKKVQQLFIKNSLSFLYNRRHLVVYAFYYSALFTVYIVIFCIFSKYVYLGISFNIWAQTSNIIIVLILLVIWFVHFLVLQDMFVHLLFSWMSILDKKDEYPIAALCGYSIVFSDFEFRITKEGLKSPGQPHSIMNDFFNQKTWEWSIMRYLMLSDNIKVIQRYNSVFAEKCKHNETTRLFNSQNQYNIYYYIGTSLNLIFNFVAWPIYFSTFILGFSDYPESLKKIIYNLITPNILCSTFIFKKQRKKLFVLSILVFFYIFLIIHLSYVLYSIEWIFSSYFPVSKYYVKSRFTAGWRNYTILNGVPIQDTLHNRLVPHHPTIRVEKSDLLRYPQLTTLGVESGDLLGLTSDIKFGDFEVCRRFDANPDKRQFMYLIKQNSFKSNYIDTKTLKFLEWKRVRTQGHLSVFWNSVLSEPILNCKK